MANNDSSLCTVPLVSAMFKRGKKANIKELIKWMGAGLTSCWWQSDPVLACHMTPRWSVCSHGRHKLITPINVIPKTNTAASIHHPPVRKHSSITIYWSADLFQNSSVSFPCWMLHARVTAWMSHTWDRPIKGEQLVNLSRCIQWRRPLTGSSERSNHRSVMSWR